TAKDKATNNEQKITITSSSGLSKEEVDKMARDAEMNAADDKKKQEEIETRNRADSMVYNVEKTLKDHGDKISEDDRKGVQEAIEEAKKAIAEGSTEKINAATDKLTQASHKLAEAMYKATAAQQPPPGGAPGGASEPPPQDGAKPKDNVVDAEF